MVDQCRHCFGVARIECSGAPSQRVRGMKGRGRTKQCERMGEREEWETI